MKLNMLLTTSAIVFALLGLVVMIAPEILFSGVILTEGSNALIAYIRTPASIVFGIAALNWMARNVGASDARNAIVKANIIWCGLAIVLDTLAFVSSLQVIMLVFAVISLFFAAAFFWVWRNG